MHKQSKGDDNVPADSDSSLLKHSVVAAVADRNVRTIEMVKLNVREIMFWFLDFHERNAIITMSFPGDATLRSRLSEEILIACCNYQPNQKANLPSHTKDGIGKRRADYDTNLTDCSTRIE